MSLTNMFKACAAGVRSFWENAFQEDRRTDHDHPERSPYGPISGDI